MMAVMLISALSISCNRETNGVDVRGTLTKSNISDAEYIYVREATRAFGSVGVGDGDEIQPNPVDMSGGWKVDKYGNESRIEVFDANGNSVDIHIADIVKLTDNYVIMRLQVGAQNQDAVYMEILVDKNTDKIYDLPYNLSSAPYTEEYPAGVLYYCYHSLFKATVTPEAVIEESILPDGEWTDYFLVNKDSVVYYVSRGGMMLMPSKRLYPVDDTVVFLSGDREFISVKWDESVKESEVYHWQVVSSSEMKRVKIATLPGSLIKGVVPVNSLNGKAVLFCYNEKDYSCGVYEVDTNGVALKRSFVTDAEKAPLYSLVSALVTMNPAGNRKISLGKNSYFVSDVAKGELLSVDASTYDITLTKLNIPADEYRVDSIEVDATTGKVVFRALRYMDGANVLGEIDAAGVIKIIGVQTSQYQITKYCALN